MFTIFDFGLVNTCADLNDVRIVSALLRHQYLFDFATF